jgi:hypothetical protein
MYFCQKLKLEIVTCVHFVQKKTNRWDMFCTDVKLFLNNVESWFMDIFSLRIVVDKKNLFLLGSSDKEMLNLINYNIKYSIYCCKCRGKLFVLNNFIAAWTNVYKVERQLAYTNDYVNQFEKKWNNFHKLLP